LPEGEERSIFAVRHLREAIEFGFARVRPRGSFLVEFGSVFLKGDLTLPFLGVPFLLAVYIRWWM
jgi:hypothetical protein